MVEARGLDLEKVKDLATKVGSVSLENLRFLEKKYPRAKRILLIEALDKTKSNKTKVILNPYTDVSFWDHERNFINIGILEYVDSNNREEVIIDLEALAKALFHHEVSHENHSEIPEKVPYPFPLLNILEDERIERLAQRKWGIDFSRMHELSFAVYYQRNGEIILNNLFNPFNLIIVKRWARWSNEIKEKVEKTIERFEDGEWIGDYLPNSKEKRMEYYEDIEKVLDDATNSANTQELIDKTLWFYEKWKHIFTSEAKAGVKMGVGHGSGEKSGDMGETPSLSEEAKQFIEEEIRKEDEEEKREWSGHNERNSNSVYFSERPVWSVNKQKLEKLTKELKKIKWMKKYMETEYTTFGRRLNPKRAENLIPNPMRRKKEKFRRINPKVLFVIDGSGSMQGFPYVNAMHIALAFMELKLPVDVILTTPIGYEIVQREEDLTHFLCNGGWENLESTKDLIKKYDLIVFFTDACVLNEDERFLKKIKSSKVIGLLTTMDIEGAEDWLPRFFKKTVVSDDVYQLIKRLALVLKRLGE